MEIENLPPKKNIEDIETRIVLKKLAKTRAALAELKGVAATIPNEQILIDTLSLQEAKDSSAIENIVTTHDELYKSNAITDSFSSAASKEVHSYAEALKTGFKSVRENGIINVNLIVSIQKIIEQNDAGIRKLPGTELRNELTKEIVYTPPQEYQKILNLMHNLESFINDEIPYEVDPIIKMAIIHHQFESIHPFYDGNGRTGRILNILYLIQQELLSLPILYISRYIIQYRQEYYSLLQETRDSGNWEAWILYILEAVQVTANDTIELIKKIKGIMLFFKQRIRNEEPRIYSQDLINSLFRHPYTKISNIMNELRVSRITATKYLDRLTELRILSKVKKGRSNYYINMALFDLLSHPMQTPKGGQIQTVSGSNL